MSLHKLVDRHIDKHVESYIKQPLGNAACRLAMPRQTMGRPWQGLAKGRPLHGTALPDDGLLWPIFHQLVRSAEAIVCFWPCLRFGKQALGTKTIPRTRTNFLVCEHNNQDAAPFLMMKSKTAAPTTSTAARGWRDARNSRLATQHDICKCLVLYIYYADTQSYSRDAK